MNRDEFDTSSGIWVFPLHGDAGEVSHATQFLTGPELRRAEHFRFERHRRRFVMRRAVRRIVLAHLANLETDAVDIREESGAKPSLGEPALEFNCSHSGDWGVIATGTRPVGVDIERQGRRIEPARFARRHFTAEECSTIIEQPRRIRELAFLCCWTGKEAYVKALGEGLGRDLKSFCVVADPAQPPGLRWDRFDGDAASRWQFARFRVAGNVLTVVSEGHRSGAPTWLDLATIREGVPVPGRPITVEEPVSLP